MSEKLEVQQPYAEDMTSLVNPKDLTSLVNPKDLIGVTKVPLWLVPSAGIIHEAMAFADGARKYGPYNWRIKKVVTSIYISAAQRHILKYLDGLQTASDSGAHELGHARACLGIILDAEETGNLADDRPPPTNTEALLARLQRKG